MVQPDLALDDIGRRTRSSDEEIAPSVGVGSRKALRLAGASTQRTDITICLRVHI